MVIIQSPFELNCRDLANALGGELLLASIAPLHGDQTIIRRVCLRPDDVSHGATYLHCGSTHNLLNDAALAYRSGANGIICAEHLPPLAGGFTILIPTVEVVHGSQYSLLARLISGEPALVSSTHRHHLRPSA